MPANSRYKDSVFSFLFNDPDTLRELYGAIQAVRLLMYIARIYEKITSGRNIYGRKKLTIPRPEFIVLYNGRAPYPERETLRLSEAFEGAGLLGIREEEEPKLELEVKVYNINRGYNEGILESCERLRGYSQFIGKVRELEAGGGGLERSMEGAIRWCIGEGILSGFFEEHGAEVVNMLMSEWKLEDALVVEREEGWEEGWERGLKEGRERGREEIARTALAKGMPPDVISQITGLDLETVGMIAGQ
jgi:hypothetical protein